MKKDIHPQYAQAKVTCSCGNSFKTGSTTSEIKVEVCSKCHPFYTGKAHLVDTEGRVDKFRAKMDKAKKLQEEKTAKKGSSKDAKPAEKGKEDKKEAKKDLREIAKDA